MSPTPASEGSPPAPAERRPASGSRVGLERLRLDHCETLLPLLADWEVARMLAEPPWPLSLSDVRAYASRTGGAADDFVVVAQGGPIGVVTLKHPSGGDPPRSMPRLGYWIGRPFWGRGYATEAVAQLVSHAFLSTGAERVGAGVFLDNPASRRVLEKLGFAAAGAYDLHCRARGIVVRTIDMRLSRSDWASADGAA